MNFSADFSDIRSILGYTNEYIEKLDKIQFLCGYQNAITDITNRLRDSLRSKAYLTFENDAAPEHFHQLRRIVFYLMLNTDVTFAPPHDLNADVAVVHVLQNMPQLSPFLLLNLLWSLRLHRFLCEAIASTPDWFAVAYLERAVESLLGSSVPELNRASRAGPLVVAVFETVHRTASSDERFVDVSLELVRQFLTCTADQLEPMAKSKRAKLLGYVMMHSLAAARRCVELFAGMDSTAPPRDESVASIFGILSAQNIKHEPTMAVVKAEPTDASTGRLLRIIMGQLNAVQTTAMQIDLDIFLHWAEWDLDEECTMQRHIGEAAHRLSTLVGADARTGVQHDVCAQLNPIAMRPKTLEQVMLDAHLGEIMTKLDSLDLDLSLRRQWLDEFLSRGILVFGNDECMDTLEGNLEHMTVNQIVRMIEAVDTLHDLLDDSGDCLRQHVYQAARQRTSLADVYALISTSMRLRVPHGVNLELDSLNVATIALFNRCTPALLRAPSTLALMLQNPVRFVQQALNTALKTDQLLATVCEFIDELPADVRPPGAVSAALTELVHRCEELPADDQTRLAALLHRLHRTQFATPAAFYQLFYRLVCEASSAGHAQTVLCLLTTLQTVLHQSAGAEAAAAATATPPTMAAPLLVMCAALMDTYRWDMATFTAQREHIVRLAIEIMHELRRRFLPLATDADRKFICDRVAGFKAHTRFYYQRFGQRVDEQPLEFATFVCPNGTVPVGDGSDSTPPPTTETQLERLLSAMVRSTRKECAMLSQNQTLRPYWFLAVALMGRVVSRSADPQSDQRTANSWACLRHVAQALAHVVRKNFQPAAANAQQKWQLISDYINLLHKLETLPSYEDLFMDAHYVILELLAGVRSAGEADDGERKKYELQRQVFSQVLAILRDCPAKMLVTQALA